MRPRSFLVDPVQGVSINVFDNINQTDAFAVQIDSLGIEKSVVDNIPVSEFVQVRVAFSINVFDTATPTETLTMQQFMKVNVFDSVPISEALNVETAFVH